ncbi:MAG: endo-1,4-beta-xylanase, partial [Phycisphaeraceae bacterium JB051]
LSMLANICHADSPSNLPVGQQVIAPGTWSSMTINGQEAGNITKHWQDGETDHTPTLQLHTHSKVKTLYHAQLVAKTDQPVHKGDVLLLSFDMRTVSSETDEGYLRVIFEKNMHGHYFKSLKTVICLGKSRGWQRINLPIQIPQDYPAGGAQVTFGPGIVEQVLELANLKLTNFGTQVPITSLPVWSPGYGGREADAPWRKAAKERIEQLRKRDIQITVTDTNGKPASNMPLQIAMTKHAYPFGSAVPAPLISPINLDGLPKQHILNNTEQFQKHVFELFNVTTIANFLKWPQWEASLLPIPEGLTLEQRKKRNKYWRCEGTGHELVFSALDKLKARDIDVRGHCLIWPGWSRVPQDIKALADSPSALRERIDNHFKSVVTATRGKVILWDVINELYGNHDLVDILGKQELIHWFQLAHQLNPDVALYINDTGILSNAGLGHARQDELFKTISYLKNNNAPIGGIGMQGHFGSDLADINRVLAILDRFGELGLPIQVTELDIDLTDTQLQADYLRDFMTAVYSHPSSDGIILWGFWAGWHWKPNSSLYDPQWNITQLGKTWIDLVHKQWWTDATVKTDANGKINLRGFHGQYKITAPNSKQILSEFELTPDQHTLNLKLQVRQ